MTGQELIDYIQEGKLQNMEIFGVAQGYLEKIDLDNIKEFNNSLILGNVEITNGKFVDEENMKEYFSKWFDFILLNEAKDLWISETKEFFVLREDGTDSASENYTTFSEIEKEYNCGALLGIEKRENKTKQALELIKTIEHKEDRTLMPMYGTTVCDNNYFDWYRPKTIQEINILNAVCENADLTEEYINKWICFEHECELLEDVGADYPCWIVTLDECTTYMNDFTKAFKDDIPKAELKKNKKKLYVATITYNLDTAYTAETFTNEEDAIQKLNEWLEQEIKTVKTESGYEPIVKRYTDCDMEIIYSDNEEMENLYKGYYRVICTEVEE